MSVYQAINIVLPNVCLGNDVHTHIARTGTATMFKPMYRFEHGHPGNVYVLYKKEWYFQDQSIPNNCSYTFENTIAEEPRQ